MMTRLTVVVAATLLASSIATLDAPSVSAAGPNQDGQLATLLGVLSQEEIALGRLAQGRASPQVQQFAQSMVADNQRIVDQLRKFHPAGPMDRLGPADAPRPKPESGDGLDYLELHRSVAAKFVDGLTRELRTWEGRAFDRAYVVTMAVFHVSGRGGVGNVPRASLARAGPLHQADPGSRPRSPRDVQDPSAGIARALGPPSPEAAPGGPESSPQ